MSVFYAILVLLIAGAVGGSTLAIASRYLATAPNVRMERIKEILPGINCGACGYSGCEAYSEALAFGNAAANLCIPGGESVASALACELGLAECEVPELMPFVNCNGTCDAAIRPVKYEGYDSCAAMTLACGGDLACKFGCLGAGDCARACPTDAISVNDGVARIDMSVCISCGICTDICPKHIITMIPNGARVAPRCSSKDSGAVSYKNCKNACIACKKCEAACKWDAVFVIDNLASVDYRKCVGCGACKEACHTGCIASV